MHTIYLNVLKNIFLFLPFMGKYKNTIAVTLVLIFVNFLTLPTYSYFLDLDISSNVTLVSEEEESHGSHTKVVEGKFFLHAPHTLFLAEPFSKSSAKKYFYEAAVPLHLALSQPSPPPDFLI